MVYWQLFIGFFRIGILGFGGGPAMIPLYHAECVKKRGWLSDEEFADHLALANALPGPIATKMASYIGYKVKGWLGALIALAVVTLPVVAGMIVLLHFVYLLKDSGKVQGTVQAIQPVIAVMMAVMAFDFIVNGWKSAGGSKRVFAAMIIVSTAAIVLTVHPGILVGAALLFSFLYSSTWLTKKVNKAPQEGK